MGRTKKHQLKYEFCKEAYLNGTIDIEVLSSVFDVPLRTLSYWRRQNNWDSEIDEIRKLEKEVEKQSKIALKAGLKAYAEDPTNMSLQSLVVLLKDFQKRNSPVKELQEYIVKFLDQVCSFYISNNYEKHLEMFQEHLINLADFLRVSNNG